jgi:hypothetical protein
MYAEVAGYGGAGDAYHITQVGRFFSVVVCFHAKAFDARQDAAAVVVSLPLFSITCLVTAAFS